MPELPEVETTRRLLVPLIVGRTIETVTVGRERMVRRQPQRRDFERRLEGRRIIGIDRHGKHLLVDVEGDVTWVIHLGMSGHISVAAGPADRPPHTHVVVVLDDGKEIRFTDPRTFGHTEALVAVDRETASFIAHGPDAFSTPPTKEWLVERLATRTAPIKALLLDQSILAGIGNIYADEALHRARISPHRRGGRLSPADVQDLLDGIAWTLEAGIAAGGTTLADMAYLLPNGRSGDFLSELAVYGRAGEDCHRGDGTILRDVIRQRSSFWCPGCQH